MSGSRWRAREIGDYWHVDNADHALNIRAHCVCCAYMEAIQEHGGDVDLRGLSRYGICYELLVVAVRATRLEPNQAVPHEEGEK